MRLAFIQMCRSLFQHPEPAISFTYIKSLTPLLITHLNSAPHTDAQTAPNSDAQTDTQEVIHCISVIELLIKLAPTEQRK